VVRCLSATLGLCLAAAVALADGPADNHPDKVRRVPPPGVTIPAADRADLEKGVADLGKAIDELRTSLKGKPALLGLLPDVEVYHKAVAGALKYDEFYDAKEVAVARKLLAQGKQRADDLKAGKAAWTTATGLVVRGYVSKIDGSVQPYGLVVPPTWQAGSGRKHRLDVWLHGRGEKLSELSFVNGRQSSAGEFTPADTFVLHPYGRYCNANRFAGEVDVFEGMNHVREHYPIDENRLVVRGFSMGGAACWQLASRHPGLWAAAAPGAGFSETADFLKVFQNEQLAPPEYQRKLWRLYDSTETPLNFANLPLVVYSGEIDKQKQAADVMEKALATEGIAMTHIIGAKAPHRYTPAAKEEINRRIDAIVALGRNPRPKRVKFTTATLRYPGAFWVKLEGLGQHWEMARVNAMLHEGANAIDVATKNVTAITLHFEPGLYPFDTTLPPKVGLDGQVLDGPAPRSDRSWAGHFRKEGDKWQAVATLDAGTLRKKPGSQGPIDDAFYDRFLMVRPTGKARHPAVGEWAEKEMAHAVEHWRRQYRGDAPVKADTAVTDADIASSNLVLWGDPASNAVLAKIADKLPIAWDGGAIRAGDKTFPADKHAAVLIYPNPLNPKRYVVLNSGFTFREYDYLNNARQTPKLPDWAVIDVSKPVTSQTPGGVAAAGFFGEKWEVK
jgi:pimeloyl-ACP methyl ester carboxylesterase